MQDIELNCTPAPATAADRAATAARRLRWCMLACFTWVLFANHWSRDSVGALQMALEVEPGFEFTPSQYNSLTSIFFASNCVMPMAAMALAQATQQTYAYGLFIALLTIGNLLVGAAPLTESVLGVMLVGRAIMGVAYEAVDMLPIGFLLPRFADSWATTVGIINGANRLGSVCNFLLAPRLYEAHGLRVAILVPSLVGASVSLAGAAAVYFDRRIARHEAVVGAATAPSSHEAVTASRDAAGGASASAHSLGRPLRRLAALARQARREIGAHFVMYVLGAACVYGAVVPFWFVGAKHIANGFDRALAEADSYILVPEGLILLVAPPFGYMIDKRRWNFVTMMHVAAAALALTAASLLCLAHTRLPPLLSVLGLGLGYAISQNLIWAGLKSATPPAMMNVCVGILGSSVNLLPTLLP